MTLRKHFLLIFFFLLLLPAQALAVDLVNINTADSATLQTLNGIGPSKAQAIIDYRTQYGLFAAIEDIQNVSGIGTATYNGIKDFITVSAAVQNQPQTQTQTQTSTQTQVQITGSNSQPAIAAYITTGASALAGAGTVFDGSAVGSKGEPLIANVRYIWNFGDGVVAEGAHALHTYAYPGTYGVQLSVAYNYSSATARLDLSVAVASVKLFAEGDGSLTVANTSNGDLDVGLWSLTQGNNTPFSIPAQTVVLAGKGVRFAPLVMGFAGDTAALLRYPNGALAASATPSAQSPLRGQQVEIPQKPATAAAVAAKTAASKEPTTAQVAAAAQALPAAEGVLWSYLVGLSAIIAVGAVGAYYAHRPSGPETRALAEEFEIE